MVSMGGVKQEERADREREKRNNERRGEAELEPQLGQLERAGISLVSHACPCARCKTQSKRCKVL